MSDPSAQEVISPDSISSGPPPSDGQTAPSTGEAEAPEEQPDIESPAKIIRIGAMVKQLLDEVRNTTLDEAAREQLRDIYENSLVELRTALSPELGGELDRLALDFDDDTVPSEAQLRIAKAQLVGWLEGLFHGIQATLMAQQMAMRSQLEVMRGQLPPGAAGPNQELPTPGGPGYI
ncbi:MAG: proteasome activator [Acidimicrobiales bacterium]